MFCPNCGKDEQQKNSYCRNCGEFLPDFENVKKRGFSKKTPEENIKTSLVLNFISSVSSIVMAILLYVTFLGKDNVSPLIYISAALFTVIGIWQMIDFITVFRLKKHFAKRRENVEVKESVEFSKHSPETRELLNEADFDNLVPVSVTEKTTKNLGEKVKAKSSQTKH